ncbi:MAG: hypothetical protein HPZ91_09050 [Lentisphaeria bacterium]|nr:hypothetical protein [Lentisphaeria bacterium]
MMKTGPQIERLCQEPGRLPDHFPAGSRFYSVRQIMGEYGCRRGVIDSVLDRRRRTG